MDFGSESLTRAVEQLLGRASGPMHFRLIMQPVVASILAIRAGMKDAREARPPFFWAALTQPEARRELLRSGWKDLSKIFVVAIALDSIYQIVALHAFFWLQTLLVAVVVAVVPYLLFRGPANRIARTAAGKA